MIMHGPEMHFSSAPFYDGKGSLTGRICTVSGDL